MHMLKKKRNKSKILYFLCHKKITLRSANRLIPISEHSQLGAGFIVLSPPFSNEKASKGNRNPWRLLSCQIFCQAVAHNKLLEEFWVWFNIRFLRIRQDNFFYQEKLKFVNKNAESTTV
jgi:hypothetical protein